MLYLRQRLELSLDSSGRVELKCWLMTTFQAIVYATLHGISEFLPISSKAHHILIPYLIGWQPPPEQFFGTLAIGSSLALLIYFRHDWASMISCFLQVLIYRKRPMT